jgi:hypothetical protein
MPVGGKVMNKDLITCRGGNTRMNQKLSCNLRQANSFIVLIIAALILVTFAPSVPAKEQSDEGGGWEFSVAPYMWFVALDGDATVKGTKSDVDIGFNDIWDELNIGGMVAFEARKSRFGIYGDTVYANLGEDTSVGYVGIDPSIDTLWAGLGGSYRVATWGPSDESGKKFPTVTVDTTLGLRYTYLGVDLDFKNVPVSDVHGNEYWFEPVLGVRTLWDLSQRWRLSLAGNIGGMAFGSDFAWGAFGLIGYGFGLFGDDNATVFGGYQALSQDYDDGHGNDKFEWDVTLHGPVIGLSILFGGKKAKAAEPPKDSDGDGVYDDVDNCPGTAAGVKVDSYGCPLDGDRDGVYDSLDKCPNTPAGVKVNTSGCPLDSDGDGVYDYLDKCPATPKGVTVDRSGCPLDSDGDGVYDYMDQCPDTPKGATVNERGCWAFGGNVFFDFNQSEIKSDAYPLLKEALNILEENPEMRVEIQGHTDNKGPEAYNQTLSEKRAMAVKTYLIKQGIDAERLEIKGYGESDPIAPNDTEEGRQKNRRVRFKRIN